MHPQRWPRRVELDVQDMRDSMGTTRGLHGVWGSHLRHWTWDTQSLLLYLKSCRRMLESSMSLQDDGAAVSPISLYAKKAH